MSLDMVLRGRTGGACAWLKARSKLCRQRFLEELTGQSPPDRPPLPPLSEEMTQHGIDLARLLEQVDYLLKAAVQERGP
jgi:hypothetical protein